MLPLSRAGRRPEVVVLDRTVAQGRVGHGECIRERELASALEDGREGTGGPAVGRGAAGRTADVGRGDLRDRATVRDGDLRATRRHAHLPAPVQSGAEKGDVTTHEHRRTPGLVRGRQGVATVPGPEHVAPVDGGPEPSARGEEEQVSRRGDASQALERLDRFHPPTFSRDRHASIRLSTGHSPPAKPRDTSTSWRVAGLKASGTAGTGRMVGLGRGGGTLSPLHRQHARGGGSRSNPGADPQPWTAPRGAVSRSTRRGAS